MAEEQKTTQTEIPGVHPDITFFAETNYRGQKRRFGIRKDDRRRHFYIIGKTGVGKSTLQEQMIMSDIHNGYGVGLVDPHGDFAEKILDFIPNNRINDVVYFNPADADYPIGFNVMETTDPKYKHLVASGLMGVFKKIWPDVWSPRMEYILNNCILALLDYPGSTLLGINRLLVDKEFRKRVLAKCENPVVKTFWLDEFAKYTEKFATEAIAPIQNKVGQFLSSSIIRNILAQVKSTINIRDLMDDQKILIMNLSKGRIGEENMRLVGGMLITTVQLAAMGRVDIPEETRKDFYLYVDEFQNFATESFANILSEARKYRLNLIIAHQYIEQLEEEVASAVFGNVGTIAAFRVGGADADFLAKEFEPEFTIEDLVNTAKYNMYLKLMIDGVSSSPFSAQTVLPEFPRTGNAEKVIAVSRERYGSRRDIIEEKISRWSGLIGGEDEPPAINLSVAETSGFVTSSTSAKEEKRRNEIRYPAICNRCGNATDAPFVPDGKRPIYCVECYKIAMAEKANKPATVVQVVAAAPVVIQPQVAQTQPTVTPVVAQPQVNQVIKPVIQRPPENIKQEKKVIEEIKTPPPEISIAEAMKMGVTGQKKSNIQSAPSNLNINNTNDSKKVRPGEVITFNN